MCKPRVIVVVYQNVNVEQPAMFSREDWQSLKVKDFLVVVSVGQGPAHLCGKGLSTSSFKLWGGIGRAVHKEFQSTYTIVKRLDINANPRIPVLTGVGMRCPLLKDYA